MSGQPHSLEVGVIIYLLLGKLFPIPFSSRCLASPTAWKLGSLSIFHWVNSYLFRSPLDVWPAPQPGSWVIICLPLGKLLPIPFSSRCLASPTAWKLGSLSIFHWVNSSLFLSPLDVWPAPQPGSWGHYLSSIG